MVIESKFNKFSIVYIFILLSSIALLCVSNCYHLLLGTKQALNLFRKLGYATGSLITTIAFAILIIVCIIDVQKKITSIVISDEFIEYKKIFTTRKIIMPNDILSIESFYEITRANLFSNELLILKLKKERIVLAKMYLKNFNEIKTTLKTKLSN